MKNAVAVESSKNKPGAASSPSLALGEGIDRAIESWTKRSRGERLMDAAVRLAPWFLAVIFLVVAGLLYRQRQSDRQSLDGLRQLFVEQSKASNGGAAPRAGDSANVTPGTIDAAIVSQLQAKATSLQTTQDELIRHAQELKTAQETALKQKEEAILAVQTKAAALQKAQNEMIQHVQELKTARETAISSLTLQEQAILAEQKKAANQLKEMIKPLQDYAATQACEEYVGVISTYDRALMPDRYADLLRKLTEELKPRLTHPNYRCESLAAVGPNIESASKARIAPNECPPSDPEHWQPPADPGKMAEGEARRGPLSGVSSSWCATRRSSCRPAQRSTSGGE